MQNLPLRIYLIRLGATDWSLSGRHTSRTDFPLTGAGKDGARQPSQRLRDINFVPVLTSPRQRARRTLDLAELGRAAEIEPDLIEWHYDDYEGKRSVVIRICDRCGISSAAAAHRVKRRRRFPIVPIV